MRKFVCLSIYVSWIAKNCMQSFVYLSNCVRWFVNTCKHAKIFHWRLPCLALNGREARRFRCNSHYNTSRSHHRPTNSNKNILFFDPTHFREIAVFLRNSCCWLSIGDLIDPDQLIDFQSTFSIWIWGRIITCREEFH